MFTAVPSISHGRRLEGTNGERHRCPFGHLLADATAETYGAKCHLPPFYGVNTGVRGSIGAEGHREALTNLEPVQGRFGAVWETAPVISKEAEKVTLSPMPDFSE